MRLVIVAYCCLLLAGVSAAQVSPSAKPSLGSVSGQVVQEPGGMPLRKALVSLISTTEAVFMNGREPQQNPYAAVTDAEGHFRIERLQPGDYRVTLERNGFIATNRRSRPYSSTSLSVSPGQEISGLLFRMFPAGVIQGKILDEDGDPVPNVNVFAVSPTTSGAPMNGTTNDLGEYRIAGLSSGEYFVRAENGRRPVMSSLKPDEGRIYAPTFYPGTVDRSQATKITVHPGDEASANFNLVSTGTFKVRGSVSGISGLKQQSGSQPGNAMVILQSAENWAEQQFQGAILPNGTFEVNGVLSGSYRARVIAPSAGNWEPIRTGQIVEVRGGDVEGLQLSPEPPSQIHGRFRMDTNSSQSPDWTQLNVQIDPDERDESDGPVVGKVAKDGSFNVRVPSATYHVVVTSNSNTEAWRDFIVEQVILNGKDVGDSGFSIAGGVVSLEIVASAQGGAIEGNVVEEDGKPVPDVPVVCIPDTSRRKRHDIYQQAQTDRQGHFSLRGLNPGEYQVFTLDDDPGDITDPAFVSSHAALGKGVKLDPGERKQIVLRFAPESQP
jgi:hypothetical protein